MEQHTIQLLVTIEVHAGMTPHDAAHQIAGVLTGNGWRAHVGPLGVPEGPDPETNRITSVYLMLDSETGQWTVSTIKQFSPENGGQFQVFTEPGGVSVHRALDLAREMVTFSKAQRDGAG